MTNPTHPCRLETSSMKYTALSGLLILILTPPSLSGEELIDFEPDDEIARAAPVVNAVPPTYIRVGNQQDTSSAIRIINNTNRKLTAHWEAVPKTATEEDYNFPFPNPEPLGPGESIEIPVTVFAEPLPGFLHQILEIFARDVAYRNWSRDEVVEDALFQYDLDRLGYRVNKTFFGSFNFQAVGLTSDEYFTFRAELRDENGNVVASGEQDIIIYDFDRPPVLALRGTEQSETQDWYTNFDPDGVGFSQFFFNRDTVEDWLRRASDPEHGDFFFRPHITGHSLGGALAQWFAASYTRSGRNLGEIVTFASPGIVNRNGFGEGTSQFDRNRADSVTHYITSGDFVSLSGERYLAGSIRQPTLIPTWVKSQYVAGPASVVAGHTQFKHSVPVLARFIDRVRRFDNPFATQERYFDDNRILDDFFFTFIPPDNPDVDYFGSLQMVAAIDAGAPPPLPRIGPLLAAQLKYRGTVELNRAAIGRTLWNTPFLVTRRIQKAWEAAKTWRRRAWQAIDEMTKKIVGSGSKLAKLQTGTAADAVNFWEASAQWPEDAWDASIQWRDFAWDAMVGWDAEQWAATVRADFPWQETPLWTQEQWENIQSVPSKRIRGRVWHDADGNGQDNGEEGLPGRIIFVDSNLDGFLGDRELKTHTQGNGEFNLVTSSLSAGTYHIRQDVEGTDWQITFPVNRVHVIKLDADPVQEITGVDFGNFCPSGKCDEDDGDAKEPPPPEALIINEDAFLLTYDDLGTNGKFLTGISSRHYACGVVGWQATGGDLREVNVAGTLLNVRLTGDNGIWRLNAGFRSEHGKDESWDRVTILCFDKAVASTGGPEEGKPIFKQRFRRLGDNVREDTGISVEKYACGIVGIKALSGDINENGTGDIIQTYLYDEGGTWHIRADFRTHDHHENWEIDLMCLDTEIASHNGPAPNKEYFLDRFTHLGDNIRFDTGVPFSEYVCGVIGLAALNGDIDERGKGAGTSFFQTYLYAQNDTWRIRADFRTHKNHEDWDVNVLCALRDGVTPNLPRNKSREDSGIDSCMGETMKCQILIDEFIDLSGKVIVTGGGYTGNPAHTGHRCGGPDYVEVYLNDRDPATGKPRWSWPDACLRSGAEITLSSSVTYDFRSVSIAGGATVPFQLSKAAPPPANRPPTITAPAFHALYWKETVEFDITAIDPDGNHLTILANGLPGGATITPTTGTGSVVGKFFWNPSAADVGDYEFSVTATDEKGAASTPKVIFIKVCESSECVELF